MGMTHFVEVGKVPSLGDKVKLSLERLGYPQLTGLSCETDGSTIVLSGNVGSFYLCQVALSIAGKVPGVRRVVNQVNVI